MRMHYHTANLDDVLRYFAEGFRDPPDGKILRTHTGAVQHKAFVDTHLRTVVFEMYVQETEPTGGEGA